MDSNDPIRSNPGAQVIARATRRRRSLGVLLCIPLGIILCEAGLWGWFLHQSIFWDRQMRRGLTLDDVGVSAMYGTLFGLISALSIPALLCRKPIARAFAWVAGITMVATLSATTLTRFFPFTLAGFFLAITAIGVHFRMADWRPNLFEAQCAVCGYDTTGLNANRCPECGTTHEELRAFDAATPPITPSPLAVGWAAFLGAFWGLLTIFIW